MITKIEFVNLRAHTMSYTALGGIRFYHSNSNMFDTGTTISTSTTKFETDRIIATIANSYDHAGYRPELAVSDDFLQLGDYGHYWLSSGDGYTFSITFKQPQYFSKMEYVTMPSASSDRGIDQPFTINIYTSDASGSDVLIKNEVVQPNMTNMLVRESTLFPSQSFFNSGATNESLKTFKNNTTRYSLNMTNDTTPAPYIAKTNDVRSSSSSYQAYRAFDSNASYSWSTNNGVQDAWLQIDFGKKTRVNCFYVNTSNTLDTIPLAFRIVGSDDELNWHTLKEVRLKPSYPVLDGYMYYFNRVAYFRFYRLEVIQSSGNYTSINELIYCFDETGITELPDREEATLKKYGGGLVEIGNPISAYGYILNEATAEKSDDLWVKKLKNKPLYISVERGEGY